MDPNAKQQVVERLKAANNVLVTVSNNPSVDDLAAAIGLSLLLSKLGKHATAVFSGTIPPAIEFLEPNKQLDKDVSGLRDFIIALDKDKADKLRYKVENDVVKIFITPYKTTITKDDLRFEEGDFNVDSVVALGVNKREDLDNAIKAHGRILHDASVLTINAGNNSSSLGTIDWQDQGAGSLCEMLVSITESFGSGLLDEQMSTAFLTGIVAETERFSNPKTTPKVMTMSAQLMAAGANQQLIANNLEMQNKQPAPPSPPPPPPTPEPPQPPPDSSQLKIDHGGDTGVQQQVEQQPAPPSPPPPPPTPEPPQPPPDSDINTTGQQPTNNQDQNVPHEKTLQELESEISSLASKPKSEAAAQPSQPDQGAELKLPSPPTPGSDAASGTPQEASPIQPQPEGSEETKASDTKENGLISKTKGRGPRDIDNDPTLGGTFNATSEQAHEDNVSDLRKNLNATLLSHPNKKPLNEENEPKEDQPTSRAKDLQPISQDLKPQSPAQPAAAPPPAPEPPQPPPEVEQPQANADAAPSSKGDSAADIEAARKAVEEAVSSQPFNPSHNPTQGVGAMPIQQEGNQEPGSPSEISIDESGNLRLPNAQPQTNQQNDSNGQDFQLPSPPEQQG